MAYSQKADTSMPFSVARLPRIEFGAGSLHKLPDIIEPYGKRLLLVTGARSLRDTPHWQSLLAALGNKNMDLHQITIDGEPSPQLVDQSVAAFKNEHFDVVLGIGGGSVLDAAKAIAGLLRVGVSVMDYLEGVGPELPYQGPAVPFIAVPTTAGTGSEATKNAVLSVQGKNGFKKSFRDDQLVAQYAVVDPELLASCPPALIAANGMDALTQLIESYISLRASPFTDALAAGALKGLSDSLLCWHRQQADTTQAREHLAYAALISGITLAQAGLGSVHGLASPLGAFFPIPHGMICGTLLACATRVNIEAMNQREPNNPALARYARVAELLTGQHWPQPAAAHQALTALLESLNQQLNLPRLSRYGVTAEDISDVVKHSRGSSMRTNPIVLSDEEVAMVIQERL